MGDGEMRTTPSRNDEATTNWRSLHIANAVQLLLGIQYTLYYNSIWPYLSAMDPTASLSFVGVIVTSYSVAQLIASLIFGAWNQRSNGAVRVPVSFGIVLPALANILYAILPALPSHWAKWAMLLSRVMVGFGSGNAIPFRAYVATASTSRDRPKAVGLAKGAVAVGMAIGPALQMLFTPIGETGTKWGPFIFNMYTVCALTMAGINVVALFVMLVFFEEHLLIGKKEDGKTGKPETSVDARSFDKTAALTLMIIWFIYNAVYMNQKAIASPLTQTLFAWNDKEVILYSGTFQTIASLSNVGMYFLLAVPLAKIDQRRLLFVGVILIATFYVLVVPWPFYGGNLADIPFSENGTREDTSVAGGCHRVWTWCKGSRHPPILVYAAIYMISLGIAFPLVSAPAAVLYSRVLGLRKQGNMQGLLAVVGSAGSAFSPTVSTFLFEKTGYVLQSVIAVTMLAFGSVGLLIRWQRLDVAPENDNDATKEEREDKL